MTKLLLNTGTLLHDLDGRPVEPGGIVLDDELGPEAQALQDDGQLVYLTPASVPLEDATLLSAAAREHLEEWAASKAGGNAEPHSGDDAGVSKATTSKGGKS